MQRMFCTAVALSSLVAVALTSVQAADGPVLTEIKITSSLDGSAQPSMFWAPKAAKAKPTPLLVFLHTWSGDYRQKQGHWQELAAARGWIVLQPNFRGPNNKPAACGSKLARQDVLDAIEYVIANYKVDQSRVYLAGVSGGGHMTMLMAGYYPERFSAASAWVGISDLAAWYRFHLEADGTPKRYAKMVLNSCGGVPGTSKTIDAAYKARSPIFHLHNVGDLPLDLNAGVNDGHTGSVPVAHTLRAFNVIAKKRGHQIISQSEMDELWKNRKLSHPQKSDMGVDASYGRELRLRRTSGKTRVTIFDGGHEGIAKAGIEWLVKHKRSTKTIVPPKKYEIRNPKSETNSKHE